MSQTPQEPEEVTATPMTAAEFHDLQAEYAKHLASRGLRGGPMYNDGQTAPLVWYDQVFERGLTPSGSVECRLPLRVGGTQNGLDVILVASHANTGDLTMASGATITVTTLESDSPDGPFTGAHGSICVTAPSRGIITAPDMLVARFAIGNFQKPWLKVKLEFSGTITGGTCDCALSHVAR